MLALAIALVICCGVSLYAAVRVTEALLSLGERLVSLREQEIKTRNAPAAKEEPIPSDLWLHAMKWKDEWAREDQLRRMRDLFREQGDWDSVRTLITAAE